MCNTHPAFGHPPPNHWVPQAGERVRFLYDINSYEGVITQVLDEPGGYVVSSDDLLLPVVCDRDSLRPLESDLESETEWDSDPEN